MAALLIAQIGFPTPTPYPTRPPRATPTRTPTAAWPTPTRSPVLPTATPAVLPTSTPTRPPARLSLVVCGWVGLDELRLDGAEPSAVTWQRNKAMPVPIVPGKQGLWIGPDGQPVRATLGDNVTVCAGTACASFFIPTPTVN